MVRWAQNDRLFFKELDEGHSWHYYVGMRLMREGFPVYVPRVQKRSDISEVPLYADEADVWVKAERWHKLEIKSRSNVAFSGPQDLPPERLPFFVTTLSSWQNAPTKPLAVVVISQQTGGMVVMLGENADGWRRLKRRDRTRDIEDIFLAADLHHIFAFETLTALLWARKEGRAGW